MKTDTILLNDSPSQISLVLDKIELMARYHGMSLREASSIRLLSEEMIASITNILSTCEGQAWVESVPGEFDVHMYVNALISDADKKRFIAVSKANENTAPKGFLSKISMALDQYLFADADIDYGSVMLGYDMDYSMVHTGAYCFSYQKYINEVAAAPDGNVKERDELEGIEKTIIESIADDIKVTVKRNSVELIAIKKTK